MIQNQELSEAYSELYTRREEINFKFSGHHLIESRGWFELCFQIRSIHYARVSYELNTGLYTVKVYKGGKEIENLREKLSSATAVISYLNTIYDNRQKLIYRG